MTDNTVLLCSGGGGLGWVGLGCVLSFVYPYEFIPKSGKKAMLVYEADENVDLDGL